MLVVNLYTYGDEWENIMSSKANIKPSANKSDKKHLYLVECMTCGKQFKRSDTNIGEHKDKNGYLCYGTGKIIKPSFRGN